MAVDKEEDGKPAGTRIINGQIVRPEQGGGTTTTLPSMLAEKVGATGVQKNAAIPMVAPAADYWAVQAGDGARLDGKAPAPLVDATGQTLDVRALRAEAAARRAAALSSSSSSSLTTSATMAESSAAAAGAAAPAPVVSKRKPLVGGKYSRLKQSGVAFQGSAHTFK